MQGGRTKLQQTNNIYERSLGIELAVADWFGYRANLIVPNVSWGLQIHECDLLVVTKSGYAYEVEIKISKADLKKDLQKRHQHINGKIKRLYFAIPEKLKNEVDLIPERAGIIVVDTYGRCTLFRKAINNSTARRLSDDEKYKVAWLGTMRIWSLKRYKVICW
jgi:hypothetical protein